MIIKDGLINASFLVKGRKDLHLCKWIRGEEENRSIEER